MKAGRRLAAILAADVVGYSRMMGADEEGTLARLKSLRRALIDPRIAEHRGRIVKTMGDGLLVEFASVVDALRCADEVQRAMANAYAGLPPERRIVFRIGIHQGDVVFENGDIFGDGVNIAARLEGIADPGGICVSSRVQEDAAGKLGLTFDDMGEQTLKNIQRPVRAYRVRPAVSHPSASERTVVGPIGARSTGGSGGSARSVAGSVAGGRVSGTLRPGLVLGHTYRIEALLGQGALGDMYRATHVELGTVHAVKLISPALGSDPKVVQLLVEEARKLARVRNDAIVNYEGLFRDEEGLRYLVTEFVEGPSLSTVLAGRRLEPDEVLRLRDRLAEGLAAVHAQGIVHRDICPDNIILPDGDAGRAKLTEFGFATTGQARDSTVIGINLAARHAFASPEQLGLFGGHTDSRSDIYSLGLVLAAAALGFGRTLDMGSNPASAIAARQKPPDLSALPASLRPVIAPMLMPRPEDRPASARALVEGAAPPRSVPSAPAMRRWFFVAGGGGIALLMVGTLVLALLRINPLATLSGGELRARLATATEGYACAAVNYTLAPDRSVRLSGHVVTRQDLARLRRETAAIPGIAALDFTVDLMPHPLCDAVAALSSLSSVPDGAVLGFAANAGTIYVGARPALDVRAPGFDSYLYIDYFDSGSGQVLHLFPNDRDRFNLRPWRNHFVLFKSGLWTLCGNAGRQLITMVAAARPLFPSRRPDVEVAQGYIASLGEALKTIPQAKRAASLLFFDLHDAPPWINRDLACPGG
ncbi:MAG TPA: protein kinase [Stellaceae bacterium]|nr:protein kinase [Stellaceae bacterium]